MAATVSLVWTANRQDAPVPAQMEIASMKKAILCGVAVALVAATPVFAKDMNCTLNKDYAPILRAGPLEYKGTTYTLLDTGDDFSGVPDKITAVNKYVSVKFNVTKPNKDETNVLVRPRDQGECLQVIQDGNDKKWWTGPGCNTDHYYNSGTHFKIAFSKDIPASFMASHPTLDDEIWATGGGTSTTNKVSQFLAFFTRKDGGGLTQIGACVEKK